jgi:hypothetical protein
VVMRRSPLGRPQSDKFNLGEIQTMRRKVPALFFACCMPALVAAGPFDQALLKLEPEERSHQACIIKGLDVVRRDPRLRRADRMKTSIFSRAILNGTLLTAKGGAVRANSRWYGLSFTCNLTPDYMKATSFSFELGAEIPKQRWDEYGLWG